MLVGIRLSAVRTARANGGVQRGVTPLAHWGVFSMSEAVREENALMSYGFFKAFRWLYGYILIPLFFFFGCLCLLLAFLRFRLLTPPFGLSVLFTPQEIVQVVVSSVYVRRVPDAQPVFLPQFLNGFHSRLVVVKEAMDAPIIAQRSDCFGKVGSRVQHDVVLTVKFGTVRTPFQPQGEEGEVVHEALEEVAGLLRLFLPYVVMSFGAMQPLKSLLRIS